MKRKECSVTPSNTKYAQDHQVKLTGGRLKANKRGVLFMQQVVRQGSSLLRDAVLSDRWASGGNGSRNSREITSGSG